jgi:ATP-dependent DNA ligase
MLTHTITRALSRLGLDQRGPDPHPRRPTPMLLQKAAELFSSSDWTYEPKWDGFRVLAMIRNAHVRLISRNGHSFTHLFAPIAEALRAFPASILLDGEVIAINDKGLKPVPELRGHFRELRTDLPPHWVRPTLVVEVEYRQRLKDGLRHAALKGLRPEKKPGLIRRSPRGEQGPC